jgi:hypothetical protein
MLTFTVRNYAQNILDKLGVHSRLDAFAYATPGGSGSHVPVPAAMGRPRAQGAGAMSPLS